MSDPTTQYYADARKDWNPYLGGVVLGLVLIATYLLMGFGLGGSAAATRVAVATVHTVAPAAIEGNAYMGAYVAEGSALNDWMIFEALGVILGGILGAFSAGRMRKGGVNHGPNITVNKRLVYAVLGGILMGFAARLARGCTSGQALTGGSVFSIGSWVFMIAVFVGGYATAPFVRRQWR